MISFKYGDQVCTEYHPVELLGQRGWGDSDLADPVIIGGTKYIEVNSDCQPMKIEEELFDGYDIHVHD